MKKSVMLDRKQVQRLHDLLKAQTDRTPEDDKLLEDLRMTLLWWDAGR